VAVVDLFICQCLQMLVASIPAFFQQESYTGIIAIKTPVSKRKSDTKTEPSSKDPSLQLGDTLPEIGEMKRDGWKRMMLNTTVPAEAAKPAAVEAKPAQQAQSKCPSASKAAATSPLSSQASTTSPRSS
jgi:hypothetical protein